MHFAGLPHFFYFWLTIFVRSLERVAFFFFKHFQLFFFSFEVASSESSPPQETQMFG